MQGLATFMPVRGTAPAGDFAAVRGNDASADEGPVARSLSPLHADWHLRFALRVALPDVLISTAVDEDGVNAWLHDGSATWAVLSALGDGRTVATQGGPRRLADELEAAWDEWSRLGAPELYDYGLTVEPHGQYAWCQDAATGPRWPLDGEPTT